MQISAIGTVANSLPGNEVILLTPLISKRYIPIPIYEKSTTDPTATAPPWWREGDSGTRRDARLREWNGQEL